MKKIYDLRFMIYDFFGFQKKDGQSSIIIRQWSKGQALITLLFFMIMGITITTAAVIVVITNAAAATSSQQGADAYYIAESGIDEGLLRVLRNPNFSGSKTFSVGDGNVTVTVANNSITATGSATNAIKTIQVQTVYNNNTLTISSRKEL